MCAAPQTDHKSSDLAMQSHGVLHSNYNLPPSTQQHSLSLWMSHGTSNLRYNIIAFLGHSSYVDSSALNPIMFIFFILYQFCNERKG